MEAGVETVTGSEVRHSEPATGHNRLVHVSRALELDVATLGGWFPVEWVDHEEIVRLSGEQWYLDSQRKVLVRWTRWGQVLGGRTVSARHISGWRIIGSTHPAGHPHAQSTDAQCRFWADCCAELLAMDARGLEFGLYHPTDPKRPMMKDSSIPTPD